MDTLHDERVALGTFLYDEPIVITRRDGTQIVDVQTLPVRFGLIEGRSVHLVIFAGQTLALYVRARMGPLFTQHLTRATGVTITADAINRFLREHPNTQRICNWVGISLPRISKARISGQDIDQTSDYRRYEQYGSKNSVMVTLHTVGWTISINAEGCLTIWHDVDELEAIRFVRDEVLPLCQ
jgi:hypothetical protein